MIDELEAAKQFARALTLDVKENSHLEKALDTLVSEKPPEEAGKFMKLIKWEVAREVEGDFDRVILPRTRALIRRGIKEEAKLRSGLGFLGSLLSVAIPSLTTAATSIYTERLKVDAQKDIAKMQVSLQIQEAAAIKRAAEAKIKAAEAAIVEASRQEFILPARGAVGPLAVGGDGLPGWVLPVGVALGGGLIVILLMRRKGKKK